MADNFPDEQNQKLRTFVENLLSEARSDESYYERIARRNRFFDVTLRFLSAILAVAAPALVTYSGTLSPAGQQSNILLMSSQNFQVFVIFLVGFSGASVTLQAVFSFDRKYANAKLTAAKLAETHRRLKNVLLTADLTSDVKEAYRILYDSIDKSIASRSEILSKYVEEDINTILSTDARVAELKETQGAKASDQPKVLGEG
ncbi:MAG: hypothetical protein AAGH38_04715 [Pseudomonadota bacterium]